MGSLLHGAQVPGLGIVRLSPFRLVWRSITVVIITVSPKSYTLILHPAQACAGMHAFHHCPCPIDDLTTSTAYSAVPGVCRAWAVIH